jgi:hypothetical protein
MPKELNKVFTMAVSGTEDGPMNLLFADVYGDESIFQEDTMNSIVNDPLFREVMGGAGGVLTRMDEYDIPVLLATQDLMEHAVPRLGHAEKGEKIITFKEGAIDRYAKNVIDVYDTYYRCTRPHKTVLGCRECALKVKQGKHDCLVKQLAHPGITGGGDFTPEKLKSKLKSRREQIAGFTFVSPRLTAPGDFNKYYREVDEHDFSQIEYHSNIVKSGLNERNRVIRFKKTVCTQCFLNAHCNRWSGTSWKVRSCVGNYPKNVEEVYTQILENATIPFTDLQLGRLLSHSGTLDKRYNRCKYAATFRLSEYRTLEFGLRRKSRPSHFEPFDSYLEAMKFLKEYNEINEYRIRPSVMTPRVKALLVEATAIYERHTSGGYGGSNHLPYYISGYYDRPFRLHISFVTYTGRYVYGDSEIRGLADIYDLRPRFKCLKKEPHEDRRYKYDNWGT